jgi:hypothetical protein
LAGPKRARLPLLQPAGRDERDVIRPIQITDEIADRIVTAMRASDTDGEQQWCGALRQFDQRRRTVVNEIDSGYEDVITARISETFWTRKTSTPVAQLDRTWNF